MVTIRINFIKDINYSNLVVMGWTAIIIMVKIQALINSKEIIKIYNFTKALIKIKQVINKLATKYFNS